MSLIIPERIARQRKANSKLHEHAEQWEKGQVRSFACVAIYEDGTITADFDIEDVKSIGELNALGAGVANLYQHLKTLRAQRFS
jgi:hypothetical protein